MNVFTVYFDMIEELKQMNLASIEEIEKWFDKLLTLPLYNVYKTSRYIYWLCGDAVAKKMTALVDSVRSRSRARSGEYTKRLVQVVNEYWDNKDGLKRWDEDFGK